MVNWYLQVIRGVGGSVPVTGGNGTLSSKVLFVFSASFLAVSLTATVVKAS